MFVTYLILVGWYRAVTYTLLPIKNNHDDFLPEDMLAHVDEPIHRDDMDLKDMSMTPATVGWKTASLLEEPFHFPENLAHVLPFPYFESHQLLDPDLYAALDRDFPPVSDAVVSGLNRRGNKSIRRIDAPYRDLMDRSPAWKLLDDYVHSQKMIDLGMKLFGKALKDNPKCKIDPDKARFIDRNETLSTRNSTMGVYAGGGIDVKPYYERREKMIGDPNELFVVMDFFHGPGNITGRQARSYSFNRHLDWPFRVFSILLYFTDTDKVSGGNLDIYDGEHIHHSVVPIAQNGGVAHFSPHPDAWHGVRTFTRKDEYRRLIQIQASLQWSVCRQ
jgi:hypothetical protein